MNLVKQYLSVHHLDYISRALVCAIVDDPAVEGGRVVVLEFYRSKYKDEVVGNIGGEFFP